MEKRGGRLSEGAVRALLLVPDVFILLVRLTLDKDVPKPTRALIGGTLAYFVLPFDLFPEGLLGGVGYIDDIVLAVAVLAQSFGGELETYARKHWSGSEDLRVVVRDITETAHSLLGENLYERVKRLLRHRGIEVENGTPTCHPAAGTTWTSCSSVSPAAPRTAPSPPGSRRPESSPDCPRTRRARPCPSARRPPP